MWFSQWYNLANIQPPVSNVTFDDHTESGFLWPICLHCCNDCDVKFLDRVLQNSQQNGKWESRCYFLFSISHLQNSQEIEKYGGIFLSSISQAHRWPYGKTCPTSWKTGMATKSAHRLYSVYLPHGICLWSMRICTIPQRLGRHCYTSGCNCDSILYVIKKFVLTTSVHLK